MYEEARYSMLARSHPREARELLRLAQDDVERQWRVYESRAAMAGEGQPAPELPPEPAEAAAVVTKGGEEE
jgi:pyruvate-ferredoxin/flavodoxin oxidoreductase